MKIFISFSIICLFLIGCTSKSPKEEVVSFYSFYGKYVSADKTKDNLLIANIYKKNSWETFIINNITGNKYTIKTLDNNYVCVDTLKNNCLIANKKTITKESVFEILFDKKYDYITIKAFNSKYVSIIYDSILTANSINKPIVSSLYIDKKKDTIFNSNFDNFQLIFLSNALLLIFLSILLFHFKKDINLSLFLLVLGGISLRIFAVFLTPYLNIWDERFHALVAKNMIENPFKPMLYTNPILPYDIGLWDNNHIWLHKQPFFLWQIALSFKLFGINEFVIRIPSLLMSSILIIIIYRIAKLTTNIKAAYYAALLYTCSFYTIELVSGTISTDHNDLAFAFYITMSIWAWTEFYYSKQKKWIFFIGLFAGLSILNKWLTGLLVYSGWGLVILFDPKQRKVIGKYIEILYSLIITLIVVFPWQLYILHKFPIESKYEFEYNTKHLFEAVEGHGGNFFFHFNETLNIYGLHFLIIFTSIILLYKVLNKIEYKIAFYTYIILIYLFFSIVATKMYSFTYCISALIYIALGGMIFLILDINAISKKYQIKTIYINIFKTITLSVICYFGLKIDKIQDNHNYNQIFKSNLIPLNIIHTPLYKKLNKIIPNNTYVIFNVPESEDICIMFYSGITAYDFPITLEIYKNLKKRNIKMATFDKGNLPEFIKKDKEVFIIN